MAHKALNELIGEISITKIKDVLHDIVAEWILNEVQGMLNDSIDELSL